MPGNAHELMKIIAMQNRTLGEVNARAAAIQVVCAHLLRAVVADASDPERMRDLLVQALTAVADEAESAGGNGQVAADTIRAVITESA